MAQEKSQVFELIFADGQKGEGEAPEGADFTEIRFLLPHLNPEAQMQYMDSVEGRTSCTVIGDAIVKSVENESEQKSDEPLKVRVTLKLGERNFTPLPDPGKIITLLPKSGAGAINAKCVAKDAKTETFCVTFALEQIAAGKAVVLATDAGRQYEIKIDSARIARLNSGSGITECLIPITEIEAIEPEVTEEIPQETRPEDQPQQTSPAPELEALKPEIGEDGSNDSDDSPEIVRPWVSEKAKAVMQVIIAMLFLANVLLLVAPSDGCAEAGVASPTKTASVVAATNGSNTVLASVVVVGNTEKQTIPMTTANLRAFYIQSNPERMPGSISGEVPPDSLGIYCENPPVYDANEKTSDIRECRIALPPGAKPGIYQLTPELSRAWFHQEDPACFVEAMLPYYSSPDDIRSGLRVNVADCEWRFDPSQKCFDYSKCTFTVPQFTAE